MKTSYGEWTTYTFISSNEKKSYKEWDIVPFILQTFRDNTKIRDMFISSIEMGFRIYSGKGNFQIKNLNFSYPPKEQNSECFFQNFGGSYGSIG